MAKAKTSATKKATQKKGAKKKTAPKGPTELELYLHAPGMNAMLRAGLGGLASVLEKLAEEPSGVELPGIPWENGEPPWEVTSERIVLRFGEAGNAREYLKRIFEFAFQIKENEGLIDLPSTQRQIQKQSVRARLQQGIMLTFLQHGQSRKGAKADVTKEVQIDNKPVSLTFRPLTSFKHQAGYEVLTNKKDGTLHTKALDIPGTLCPGAAVRHNKYAVTKYEGTASELLAAYFALIGTLPLPINRGSAVLIVPEVTDLLSFGENRSFITPTSYAECLIGGTGDAVLGVYARLRQPKFQSDLEVPEISAYLFRPTVWASQQKSRVAAVHVKPLELFEQKVFDSTASFFRSQLRPITVKIGKGKNAEEREQFFFSHSIVKPLVAENLATGKPWYHNFSSLFTRNDPASGKPLHPRLVFEKEGLIKMVNSDVWEDDGKKALVRGVHFALKCQLGKISQEFGSNKAGMNKKFSKEFEKWRLLFVGSKTADQFRFAVCDLVSRSRGNAEIQESWQQVLPLLSDSHWQHGRDLALLALASYKGRGDKEAANSEDAELVAEEAAD